MASLTETVLVAGGGVMGSGIALACALGGRRVYVLDVDESALANCQADIHARLDTMGTAGLLPAGRTAAAAHAQVAGIGYALSADLPALAPTVAICFEAVPDALGLKQAVITALDRQLPRGTPVATNSSALAVDDLAAAPALRHPERLVAAHWINPAHLMPPVEVSPGSRTDPAAVDITIRCLQAMGKRPIRLSRDIPGRVANRLHFALLNVAARLVEEGVVSADDVDAVITGSFLPRVALFGLFGAQDLFGRKRSSYELLAHLFAATGDPVYAPTQLHREKGAAEAAAGAGGAVRWRSDGPLPSRGEADARLAALLRHLGGGEHP